MKIVLFGKNGQVGHELQRTLLPLGNVVALGHADGDLADPSHLTAILENLAPDVIVNAAAYTAVDKAESDQALARKINTEAVALLADFSKRNKSLLVHYSTDYVFDGEKTGPYLESDTPNPQNVYGQTKLSGEIAIEKSGCAALVFRTSWVCSAHGKNFIKTIFRLANERAELSVVADQTGSPTCAELIADVTALSIAAFRAGTCPAGLYHLTASGQTTWNELARHVVERATANGAALKLNSANIRPIATEDYPAPAKRPKNSVLSSQAINAALGIELPDWKVHIDRVIDQLTKLDTSS